MAAKVRAGKGGLHLGRRRAKRTRAGTVVLYGQALVGNREARDELRRAVTSARKAYSRGSDKEVGRAARSLSRALRIAERKREKPRSARGPALAAVAVAGAGAAVAVKRSRSSPEQQPVPVAPQQDVPVAA